MRNAIVMAIIGILVPIIVVKPHVGIYAWSWLSYMNPHRLAYGNVFAGSFALIIALVTIFAYVVSREPKRYPLNTVTVTLFLLHIWVSITTVFAINSELAVLSWIEASKMLLMTYLTVPLINTRRRLEVLAWVIALSIGFYGIKGGIWVVLTGNEWELYGPPKTMIADNNSLALALSMVIPLFGYFFLELKAIWARAVTLFCIVMCSIAIAGTYARGVYVGVGAMLFLVWLRSKYRIITGVAGVLAVLGVFMITPPRVYEELSSIKEYQEDHSSLSRLIMWRFGWSLAVDRPIVGGGFAIYPYEPIYPKYGLSVCTWEERITGKNCVVDQGRSSHSNYFQVLGEHGFVGLALYGILGLSAFFWAVPIIRVSKTRDDLKWAGNMARMLQLSIFGYAVGGMFYNMAFFNLYYHLVVMMVITRTVVEAEARRVDGLAPSSDPGVSPLPAPPIPVARQPS